MNGTPRYRRFAPILAATILWLAADARVEACAGLVHEKAQELALLGDPVLKADGVWSILNPMLGSGSEFSAAIVGGRVYVAGGFGGPAALRIYDPGADSWSLGPNLLNSTHHAGVVAVANKIYVFGGTDAESRVQIYDPAAGSWSFGADMPTARTAPAAVAFGGKVHVFGGSTDINSSDAKTEHEVYDPATDAWSSRAPLPVPSEHVFARALGGRIYVLGGRTGFNNLDDNQIYDPDSDTWSEGAPLPVPTSGMAVEALAGKLYVFAGENIPFAEVIADTQVYDPSSDSWRLDAPVPNPVHGHASAVIGGSIYLFGGSRIAASAAGTPFVQRFQPGADTGLAAPRRLKARALSPTRVRLKWKDRSRGEDVFVVEMRTGSGEFEEVATVNGNDKRKKKLVISGLAAETTYAFRVQARGGGDTSDYSNTATVTTPE